MKQLATIPNGAGGFDLIVERDAGNPVRVLTGKKSLEFFKELKDICEGAINVLEVPENMPAEKQFKVVWDIEINAISPLHAAREAQKWLQSKGNDWSFYVQENGKNKPIFSVDLQEEDENAVLEIRKEEYVPIING